MGNHKVRFLLTCTLMLTIPVIQSANCLLAPYSETRSFRDALEGRSLEEAISGPVDKDMNSYGERGASLPPPPMMLTVPANGNLDARDQQKSYDSDNQQQDENKGLEREPLSSMDLQQQMMERNYGRQANGMSQMMNGRYMKQQMISNAVGQKQQSTYASNYDSNSSASGASQDPSFGEEPSDYAAKARSKSAPQRVMMMNTPKMSSQNMIMSLANKAKYMSMQQRSPMTGGQMSVPASGGYGQMMNPTNDEGMGYTMSPLVESTSATPGSQIRKMSPAMMNAMLNKLMNMKQKYERQQAPSMMMSAVMSNNAMSPAMRDQYKQTIMAALMQQRMRQGPPANSDYGIAEQQQQQTNDNLYGHQQQMGDQSSYKPMSVNSGSYTMEQRPSKMLTQRGAAGQQVAGYGNQMTRNMQTNARGRSYGNQMMSQGLDYEQKRDMQDNVNGPSAQNGMDGYGVSPISLDGAGYGSSNQRQLQKSQMLTGMMKALAKKMSVETNSYGNAQAQSGSMNGFSQAYDQQQQQQRKQTANRYKSYANEASDGDDRDSQGQSDSRSIDSESMGSPTPAYGQEDVQQEQQHDVGGSKKSTDYGAAPAGMAEPFAFDYKIKDGYGNGQYRKEESDQDGAVRGTYGYMDAKGIYRHVEYIADEKGFRAKIKSNEPGLSNSETGERGDSSSMVDGQLDSMNSGMANDYQKRQRQDRQDQQQVMMPMQTELNADAEK